MRNFYPPFLPFVAKSSFRSDLYSFLACSPVIHHSYIFPCRNSLSAHVSLEDTVVVATEMLVLVTLDWQSHMRWWSSPCLRWNSSTGKYFTSDYNTDLHSFQTLFVFLVLSLITATRLLQSPPSNRHGVIILLIKTHISYYLSLAMRWDSLYVGEWHSHAWV